MRRVVATGEVRPWEGVGIEIELRGDDVQLVMTPQRAEEIGRKLLALAAQFVTDEEAATTPHAVGEEPSR